MSDRPHSRVLVSGFSGLLTNADAQDIPPGAATELVNFTVLVPGELRSRHGFKPVTLSGGSVSSAEAVIAGTMFRTPVRDWIVYELADGRVVAGYV